MSADECREIRLWDTQWINVVNADYSGMTKDDAIAAAVKATEEKMARNYANNCWPPARKRSTK